MIRSQMISFRAQYVRERNLQEYIQLLSQVFQILKQSTQKVSFSLSNVASSIRQVVLKNDCLQQKDDLLDFFFICEKSIKEKPYKTQSQQESKNWLIIVGNKIKFLEGLKQMYQIKRKVQLKRGFGTLKAQISFEQSLYPELDLANIEVQQDIKLKTLYFFKWCKFIEYGKTIKKLRLKEIDDLRKSLTFNMYAVKFSCFHNWRKQALKSKLNRQKFDKIQINSKKQLATRTLQGFYTLYEIKKIQDKLVQKVQSGIGVQAKRQFFSKLNFNRSIQQSKQFSSTIKMNNTLTVEGHKNKYRFIYYLTKACQIQPIKSNTLSMNFQNNQKVYSLLCAKSAFNCLRSEVKERQQMWRKIELFRKKQCFVTKYNQFKHNKQVNSNQQQLFQFVNRNKLKKGLQIIHLNLKLHKHSELILMDSQQNQIHTQNSIWLPQNSPNLDPQQLNGDFLKILKFKKLKETLIRKIVSFKIQRVIKNLTKNLESAIQLQKKKLQITKSLQSHFFYDLKKNHEKQQSKILQIKRLDKIHNKNLMNRTLRSMRAYKQIKLSHEESLEIIQQKIINPKQVLTAFNMIYQRKCKKIYTEQIFKQMVKFTTKLVFQKCFSAYLYKIQRAKQMKKACQQKNLLLLFNFLKKNKEYNQEKVQQIKQKVISKLSKQYFLRSLKQNCQFQQKFSQLDYFTLGQRQRYLIDSLKQRKSRNQSYSNKSLSVQKHLGLSLLSRKVTWKKQQQIASSFKYEQMQNYLRSVYFSRFIKSFNQMKQYKQQMETKGHFIQILKYKSSFKRLLQSIQYQERHKKDTIQSKVRQIGRNICEKSFLDKFQYYSKSLYLQRWVDWKKKLTVIQKLETNKEFSFKEGQVQKMLKEYQMISAWREIVANIQRQRQTLGMKQSQLSSLISYNRKKNVQAITAKIRSLRQTRQAGEHLASSIKLKYFSKFMRNSLIIKYQKVKQFCAIKSYARNLKLKSFKGLRMMLMRLRGKQNRLRTQQQIMVKVDKALHHSRKNNKLSETIQRFNCMKQSTMFGPR